MTTATISPSSTLLEAVGAIANDKIIDDIKDFRSPPQCSLDDILLAIRPRLVDAMRELAITGAFKPGLSINKVPLLQPIESTEP